ncbi:hypothetical protein JXJ21_10645 [candidate division KSB1 bacterium]|nr:hypothetical protein [candidate division KSB1 bacterium]
MKQKQLIWTTVLGTAICILIAIVFFGTDFLNPERPPIYLLTLGFAGSLSLALLRSQKLRDVIYINILIYFVFAILSTFIKPITAAVLLIYYVAMLIAIYIHVRNFDRKLSHIAFARPLVLAALVGVLYIAANFIHNLMFISKFEIGFLLRNMPIGFLLGLGQGIGGEICDRYVIKAETSV